MPTNNPKATDGQPTTPAFLGSPTQSYIASSTPKWTRIDLSSTISPAFLGSPTQHYHRFAIATQTAAVAGAAIRRILLKLGRASTRNRQQAQPKGPLPRAPQS
jgi:hypothetical protein